MGCDEQANEKEESQMFPDKQAPPTPFKESDRLTLSLLLEEEVA